MEPLVAEFVGTMLLILLGDGVVANVVLNKTKGNNSGWIVITTGWGLAVFVGAYSVAAFSGAHINPAVTLGLALNDSFGDDFFTGWGDVPLYMIAQLAGAFVGAVLVWITYYQHFEEEEDPGKILAVFSTGAEIRNPVFNTITEIIGTFALVFGIFAIVGASADVEGVAVPVDLGALGIIPVAFLVWGIGLSLGGPTGYAINPARDLGPRIAHLLLPISGKGDSDWEYSWIPVVGPFIGAAIAAIVWGILV